MQKKVVIIANPVALRASKKKILQAADLFRSGGRHVEVVFTGHRGHAERIATEFSAQRDLLVIAAGGDGTINEVINGLAGTDTPMAILPLGTTNVLAKEVSIPEEIRGAVASALTGQMHAVSLGRITLGHTPSQESRYFSLMAGIGFDAEAVYGCAPKVKRRSGKLAYIISGIRTLVGFSPEPLTFLADGEIYSGYGAIIGNAAKYGGHFKVTPDASLFAPELSLFIMQGKRRSDIVRYLLGILRGTHLDFSDVVYRSARSVAVKGNARVQIDGDYIGRTPAVITVEPHALRLVF